MNKISPALYWEGIVSMMKAATATDSKGDSLGFEDGMELACSMVEKTAASNSKVMLIGNGGSAGIASHMAVDFWKNGGIKALAFNDSSVITCIGNDYGYEHIFEKPLEMFTDKGDLLFAISSSGCSENILKGVDAARKAGASVVSLSGFTQDNPLRSSGDCNFFVPSGAYGPVEVIHQAIIHAVLDIYMVRAGKLTPGAFLNGG